MSNMNYVMFENTHSDLIACYNQLQNIDIEGLSDSEKTFAIALIKICQEISDDFMDDVERIERLDRVNQE